MTTRGRSRAVALLGPGLSWLVVFFALPLAFIFAVSLGQRDAYGGVDLSHPSFANYLRALEPTFLPTVWNSLRYASLTTILSIAIAYPERSSWTSGTDGWLVWWFVVSTATALCLRRWLNVNV